MAEPAPTRRSSRGTSAPSALEAPGVLTRAELRRQAAARAAAEATAVAESAAAAETADEDAAANTARTAPEQTVDASAPSVAETVVADVAAAIMAESLGAHPDAGSRRRLRRAAQAVFAEIAETPLAEYAVAESEPADHVAPGSTFAAEPEPCHLDEFEFAARLFSFTGETPMQRVEHAEPEDEAAIPAPVLAASTHTVRRRPRRTSAAFQRVAAASFSIGVMAIVGMLAVGTTTPAEALASASTSTATADITAAGTDSKTAPQQIQAFVANGANDVQALDRSSNYDVASMADIAAASGVTEFAGTWVNDATANIQWPFPVGVPISAAFGSSSYLSQFSSPHRGVDLTPGLGAEIHAIAAGTVRIATESGGDYGVTVVLDHVIDGQLVSTRYGHMLRGSLKVAVGDTVTAGEVIGNVGQTGKATGPHLHFEVLLGGTTQIDPMPWMYEHTKGTHTVG